MKSTKMIGDGKLPNIYWVSISDDYYYYNQENKTNDWINERDKKKREYKMIGSYSTYNKALEVFEKIELGTEYRGIFVRSKFIEDRLSGEIASEIAEEQTSINYDVGIYQDTKFTENKLKENGIIFE